MIAFLRNLFIRDLGLKLFSLLVAILVWLTVSFAKKDSPAWTWTSRTLESTYVNIPLVVEIPAATEVRTWKVSPQEVQVTVRGEPRLMKSIRASSIRATIDVTGIDSSQTFQKLINVSVPPGVTVTAVIPEKAVVTAPTKQ